MCLAKALWSPMGKPVAPSSTPVGRNPEQEPPAKAGARVEGSISVWRGTGCFWPVAGLR